MLKLSLDWQTKLYGDEGSPWSVIFHRLHITFIVLPLLDKYGLLILSENKRLIK